MGNKKTSLLQDMIDIQKEKRIDNKNKERDLDYYSKLEFSVEEDKFDPHILNLRYGNPESCGSTVLRCMDVNLKQLKDLLCKMDI